MLLAQDAPRWRSPGSRCRSETQGCFRASSDVRLGHAEDRDRGVAVVLDQEVEEGVDRVLAAHLGDLGQGLALERHEVRILEDGEKDRLGAGDLLPLVVPGGGRGGLHLLADARPRGGVLQAGDHLGVSPSCAQGGMKAEKELNQAG